MKHYTPQQFATWRERSDEYIDVSKNASCSRQTRNDAGFEAAYFAFIAVLARCDKLLKFDDHPSIKLSNAAGTELRLSGQDRELAVKLTQAYYDGDREKFDPDEVKAWAQRVRQAVWGVSG